MQADGQVIFQIEGDNKGLKSTLQDTTSAIQNESKKWDNAASSSAQGMESSFSGALKNMAAAFSAAQVGKMLLDFGFATYKYYSVNSGAGDEVAVKGGIEDTVPTETTGFSTLLGNGLEKKITEERQIAEFLSAPVKKGDEVGRIIYKCDGEVIGEVSVRAAKDVRKIGFLDIFLSLVTGMCL
jgi:D-alanyl-D-alanine carboxypeptidase (penicillin-binding protein 5/6)